MKSLYSVLIYFIMGMMGISNGEIIEIHLVV